MFFISAVLFRMRLNSWFLVAVIALLVPEISGGNRYTTRRDLALRYNQLYQHIISLKYVVKTISKGTSPEEPYVTLTLPSWKVLMCHICLKFYHFRIIWYMRYKNLAHVLQNVQYTCNIKSQWKWKLFEVWKRNMDSTAVLCDIVSEASVSQNCVEMNRQTGRAMIALYQLHKYSVI